MSCGTSYVEMRSVLLIWVYLSISRYNIAHITLLPSSGCEYQLWRLLMFFLCPSPTTATLTTPSSEPTTSLEIGRKPFLWRRWWRLMIIVKIGLTFSERESWETCCSWCSLSTRSRSCFPPVFAGRSWSCCCPRPPPHGRRFCPCCKVKTVLGGNYQWKLRRTSEPS